MAIPSTASRWQPAPPTDGKPQNQGALEEIPIPLWSAVASVVKAYPWLNRLRLRYGLFPHHEHIARNGSGPRSGCAASAQRNRPIVALTVPLLRRLPRRGAPSQGRSVTLCAPGVVSENTS